MIGRAPIGTIYRPLNPISGVLRPIHFNQCIHGQEPQSHKLWCMVFYNISRKVRPTAHAEVPDRAVGEFVTNYLSENGRQTKIIRQLSVNVRVQFLGLSEQAWRSGLSFIANHLDHV